VQLKGRLEQQITAAVAAAAASAAEAGMLSWVWSSH